MNVSMHPKIPEEVYQMAERAAGTPFTLAPLEVAPAARGGVDFEARQVYGEHLGNYVTRVTDGMRKQITTTRPQSVLFMDSMVGDNGNQVGEIVVMLDGISVRLFFRPHYDPNGQFSPASVGQYISVAKDRLRKLLLNPDVYRVYRAGRLWVKMFNETNIGTEGVPRGRAGFAVALSAWNNAHDALLLEFPLLKSLALCPTMGNDDGYFFGNDLNAPYWFHGSEAADEAVLADLLRSKNPADWTARTRQRVEAAKLSCPMRPMFLKAHGIGAHIYGNLKRTTSGDWQTWFSRRHEQWLPFLPTSTPLVISEWDFCHDESPQVRAEETVWWLTNVVAPNERISDITMWWNATFGEADDTWAKNYTRNGSDLYPVAVAVGNWRNGSSGGGNGGGNGGGTTPPDMEREVINVPDYVKITESSTVQTGKPYWYLKKIEMIRNASGGLHHVFIQEPHTNAAVGFVTWGDSPDQRVTIPLDQKPAGEPAGNIPMYSGNHYTATMKSIGAEVPSDLVTGMRLGGQFEREHDSYYLTFVLRTREIPSMTLEQALIQKGDAAQVIQYNPSAALQKAIFNGRDSNNNRLVPNSQEFPVRHDNKDYVGQRAESYLSVAQLQAGMLPEVYVYYAPTNDYGAVSRVQKK